MYIKIKSGVYGHREGKSIVPKTPKDAAFEVSDDKAERLIKLGVAEVADATLPSAAGESDLLYHEGMTNKQLEALITSQGLTVPRGAKKSDLLDILDAYYNKTDDGSEGEDDEDNEDDGDEDDGEEFPDLSPNTPTL